MQQEDEQAIRALVSDWHCASADGDAERLKELMADDVVFLAPGQPPMCGRKAFLDAFQEGLKHFRLESRSEVVDLYAVDDLAYCWMHLSVTVTPHQQGLEVRRSGNTLTILRKQADGRWLIVRDANMLTPEPAHIPMERAPLL
ncbi:SgcJ/EcaC family oxidoreductase [Noviherbaspirillum agri]